MMERDINDILNMMDPSSENTAGGSEMVKELGSFYRFSDYFTERVMYNISTAKFRSGIGSILNSMDSLFLRVAITGAAAVLLLSVSVFLSRGNFSIDTLVGLGNSVEEEVITLLSGNI